jgi:ferredoxin
MLMADGRGATVSGHIYLRGSTAQRLRLASGIILFVFAAAHFLNHALGLVSLEVMHLAQEWRWSITRSWPGTVILLASLLTHTGLGLWKLAQRRTLRMPLWELLQLLIAIAIPFSLLPHIVDTRIATSVFGVDVNYLYELLNLWPDRAVGSIGLILLVWVHSCIGLHYWLRLGKTYRRMAPWLLAVAVAVPILASAGFVRAGQLTAEIMSDPDALQAFRRSVNWPTELDQVHIKNLGQAARYGFAIPLAAALLLFFLRRRQSAKGGAELPVSPESQPHASGPRVEFLDGPTVTIAPGATLLEASRAAGLLQASACGGRARCGTCRVRILAGAHALPPPNHAERELLAVLQAQPDVRIACQTCSRADVVVEIIVRPGHLASEKVEFLEVKKVAEAHRLAMLLGSGSTMPLTPHQASEGGAIHRLAAEGLTIGSRRVAFLLDEPVTAVAATLRGQPATLMILPATAQGSLAVSGIDRGVSVVGWSDGENTYLLASEVPRADLERLIERASVAMPVESFAGRVPAGPEQPGGSRDLP